MRLKSCKQKILRLVVQVATFLGVPSDKVLHFLCALAMMAVTMIAFPAWLAVFSTAAVCIGKEVYDCYKKNPTGFSWDDLVADALGMLLVLSIWMK